MVNPHEILGIPKDATKDEIRRAYKKLAKEYHPDKYRDNPLQNLAEEKMQEVNEAYTILMDKADGKSETKPKNSNTYGNNTSHTSKDYTRPYDTSNNTASSNMGSASTLGTIRTDIYSGNLSRAEKSLNAISDKNAEWNYLMGLLYQRRGWYDSAHNYFIKASQMDPTNSAYRDALDNMHTQNTSFSDPYKQVKKTEKEDICDMCFKMYVLNLVCKTCSSGDD